MKALTPAMVVGSTLTPRRCRISGNVATVSAASLATSAFHSSADFGCAFQIGESGRAITASIAGLTVSGTGTSRSGKWRGAFSANDAEMPAASAMPIAASAMRRHFIGVLPLVRRCAEAPQPIAFILGRRIRGRQCAIGRGTAALSAMRRQLASFAAVTALHEVPAHAECTRVEIDADAVADRHRAVDRSAHLRFAWFCLWSPRQKAEVPVRAVASVRDALLKHDGAEALGRSRIESGIRQRQTGIGVEA